MMGARSSLAEKFTLLQCHDVHARAKDGIIGNNTDTYIVAAFFVLQVRNVL